MLTIRACDTEPRTSWNYEPLFKTPYYNRVVNVMFSCLSEASWQLTEAWLMEVVWDWKGRRISHREERSDGCSSATRNRQTTIENEKLKETTVDPSVLWVSLLSPPLSFLSGAQRPHRWDSSTCFYFVIVVKMWGFIISAVHCVCERVSVCVCEAEISSPVKVTESLTTSWEDFFPLLLCV